LWCLSLIWMMIAMGTGYGWWGWGCSSQTSSCQSRQSMDSNSTLRLILLEYLCWSICSQKSQSGNCLFVISLLKTGHFPALADLPRFPMLFSLCHIASCRTWMIIIGSVMVGRREKQESFPKGSIPFGFNWSTLSRLSQGT
jgi:hypothetical protein